MNFLFLVDIQYLLSVIATVSVNTKFQRNTNFCDFLKLIMVVILASVTYKWLWLTNCTMKITLFNVLFGGIFSSQCSASRWLKFVKSCGVSKRTAIVGWSKFWWRVCVVTLLLWFFCGCKGFRHRIESVLFLFLLKTDTFSSPSRAKKNWAKSKLYTVSMAFSPLVILYVPMSPWAEYVTLFALKINIYIFHF